MTTLTIRVQTPGKSVNMSIWSEETNPEIQAQLVRSIEEKLKEKGVTTIIPEFFTGNTVRFMLEKKCIFTIDIFNRKKGTFAEDLRDTLDTYSHTQDISIQPAI